MLVVSARDLRQGRFEWEEEVEDPAAVWPDAGSLFIGPVQLRGAAERTRGGDVHVVGCLEGEVRLACRRCLRDVDQRLEIPLDLWFRRDATEIEADGAATFALDAEGTEVDLVPALREELLLEIPSYPLCSADCAGLCPKCGARRDAEGCDCSFEERDPRWDALRALR